MRDVMHRLPSKALLVTTICFFIFGCAAASSTMKLAVQPVTGISSTNGQTVFLNSVKDNRAGRDKDLSINIVGVKSLGGIASPLSVATGLEDINRSAGRLSLENYQTVSAYVAELMKRCFARSGYTIVDKPSDDTIVIDVNIDKLWVSCQPRMMMNISSDIAVGISLRKRDVLKQLQIDAREEKSFHIGTDHRYLEVLQASINKFEERAVSQLKAVAF